MLVLLEHSGVTWGKIGNMFDCFQKIFHIFYKISYELYMHFLCTFCALIMRFLKKIMHFWGTF